MAGTPVGQGSLPFLYNDFHGGLNLYNKYDLLEDSECRDCWNVQGTTAGAIVKRPGLSTWATLANSANTDLYSPTDQTFVFYDSTAKTLVSVTGFPVTLTTLKTGLTAAGWVWVRGPKVSGQGPSYGQNGFDTPQQWDESSSATVNWTATDAGGAVPVGRYMIYHQNQVFVSGNSNFPSRVWWSGLADPTAWNPANLNGSGFMDFDPNDGQSITGLGTAGPYLIVFKQFKAYILLDPATASVRRLSDSIGSMGGGSIVEGTEGLYFRGGDGQIYVTDGSKITRISDKISPLLNTNNSVSQQFGSTSWLGSFSGGSAAYYNSHYYIAGSTGVATINGVLTSMPVTLDFDVRLGTWWKHSIAGYFSKPPPQTGHTASTPTLYLLNSGSNFLSKAFTSSTNQDNGTNFLYSWTGPWQSPSFYRRRRFPTTYFRKRLRQMRIDGLGQVDISLAKDFGSETLLQSDIFANATTSTLKKIFGQGVARAFSLQFSGTYNSYAQINAYDLQMLDRRDQLAA